ncbi:hypothetical protein BS17DRAFT_816851 [Gyrodon lividus]|nr:hypothetical protein BS17DRAFT_816851 [Gyrodon lividus]
MQITQVADFRYLIWLEQYLISNVFSLLPTPPTCALLEYEIHREVDDMKALIRRVFARSRLRKHGRYSITEDPCSVISAPDRLNIMNQAPNPTIKKTVIETPIQFGTVDGSEFSLSALRRRDVSKERKSCIPGGWIFPNVIANGHSGRGRALRRLNQTAELSLSRPPPDMQHGLTTFFCIL